MSHYKLTIPRGEMLNANDRLHWAQKAKRSRMIRNLAQAHAMTRLTRNPDGVLDRAHIVVYVAWPDRRRRDVHNVMPTVKAAVDGFVDAGLIPDDSDQHLVGPDLRVSADMSLPGTVDLLFEVVAA